MQSDGDLLRAIAGMIEGRGWWNPERNHAQDRGNKQCIMTAYSVLTGSDALRRPLAVRRLADALVDDAPGLRGNVGAYPEAVVMNWNDTRKSKRAVITRLRELAEKWDADDGKMLQDQ